MSEHTAALKRAAEAIIECRTAVIRGGSAPVAEAVRNEKIYTDFPKARTDIGSWNYVIDRAMGMALDMLIEERGK